MSINYNDKKILEKWAEFQIKKSFQNDLKLTDVFTPYEIERLKELNAIQ